jgi:hypothetical protein
VVLVAEHRREVSEDLVQLLRIWARRSFEAATNCIARVICLMFLTAPIRRRMSR